MCIRDRSQTESPAVSGEPRDMRRLLRTVMRKHGFQSYWREWWHFSFATSTPGPARDFPIEVRRAD